MTKKDQIIERIMHGYKTYTKHSGEPFRKGDVKDLLNRIIESKGSNGYQLRVNDKFAVNMSAKLYEAERGHPEWFSIGSYLTFGVWHIGGKLVRIETEYKTDKETV